MYNFRKVIRNNDLELKERLLALENAKLATQNSIDEHIKNETNEIPLTEIKNDIIEIQNTNVEVGDEFMTFKIEENDFNIEYKTELDEPSETLEKPNVNTLLSKSPIFKIRTPAHTKQSKPYQCTKCNLTCIGYLAWVSHKRNVHYERVACDICGKRMRKENLSKHVRNHSHGHVCKECGENFKNYHNLRKHIYERHKQVELYCEICGKMYHYHGDFNRHVKKHCKFSVILIT